MKELTKKIGLGVIGAFLVAISAVGVISGSEAYAADGGPCKGSSYANGKVTYNSANDNDCSACIGSRIADGSAYADSTKTSTQKAVELCQDKGDNTVDSLWTTVRTAINWVLIAVGLICVIFMIIGGIKYATSGGDTEKVKNAKNTLLYAVIGLAVALLAGVIVNIVFDILGNVN